jgi:hypothetical protein
MVSDVMRAGPRRNRSSGENARTPAPPGACHQCRTSPLAMRGAAQYLRVQHVLVRPSSGPSRLALIAAPLAQFGLVERSFGPDAARHRLVVSSQRLTSFAKTAGRVSTCTRQQLLPLKAHCAGKSRRFYRTAGPLRFCERLSRRAWRCSHSPSKRGRLVSRRRAPMSMDKAALP